jgi:hypothetical protein
VLVLAAVVVVTGTTAATVTAEATSNGQDHATFALYLQIKLWVLIRNEMNLLNE